MLFILFLSPLLLSAQSDTEAGVRRFGLFIGANDGGRDREVLRYAISDARSFSDLMEDIGGIARNDSFFSQNPTLRQLDSVFEQLRFRMENTLDGQRKELIVYYSGHSNEQGIFLGESIYTYSQLKTSIDALDAEVNITILDSCSSGAFTRVKGGVTGAPFLNDSSVEASGYAYLTSSAADEVSQESDAIGSSFFTYHLLSGLRGAADMSGNGRVSLNEVYSYASENTLRSTESTLAGAQHPSYDFNLIGSGDLVLTDINTSRTRLLLESDVAGLITIRLSNGVLIMELEKEAGIRLSLALPSGDYRVAVRNGNTALTADATLHGNRTETLSMSDFRQMSLQSYRARGGILGNDSGMDDILKISDETGFQFGIVNRSETDIGTQIGISNFAYNVNGAQLALASNTSRGSLYGGAQISLLFNKANDLDGVQAALLYNEANTFQTGLQLAVFGNRSKNGNLNLQISGLYNITGNVVNNIQIASIMSFNQADIVNNFNLQVSGLFNTVRSVEHFNLQYGVFFNRINDSNGNSLQISGLFNMSGDADEHNLQFGGLFNVAEQAAVNLQASGLFNISESSIRNLQFGGLFNVAKRGGVTVQAAGLLNVADTVKGLQIGLINVADRVEGVQLGLVNYSAEGKSNIQFSLDSLGYLVAGLQIGGRYTYTSLKVGLHIIGAAPQYQPFPVSVGYGVHVPVGGRFFMDASLGMRIVFGNSDWGIFDTQHGHFNLAVGYEINDRFAVHVGGDLYFWSTWLSPGADDYMVPEPDAFANENRWAAVPGFYGGIRFMF